MWGVGPDGAAEPDGAPEYDVEAGQPYGTFNVVCYLLFVVCCLLIVVCCSLFVGCCLLMDGVGCGGPMVPPSPMGHRSMTWKLANHTVLLKV